MKTFNDLFNVCNNISENGIMNVQADDMVEVVDFAKTVLSNILWFVENYEDESPTDAVNNHSRDAVITLSNMFDELEYYTTED